MRLDDIVAVERLLRAERSDVLSVALKHRMLLVLAAHYNVTTPLLLIALYFYGIQAQVKKPYWAYRHKFLSFSVIK